MKFIWSVNRINKFILNNYDYLVNNINCKYAWKCNQSVIKNLYKNNISKNHLEIGPGTGYFLKDYHFNNLALMDINRDILKESQNNLKINSKNITIYQHNIFDNDNRVNNLNLDSIGLTYVLHCVPGKLDFLLNNLVKNLNSNNYTIFGATVIPNSNDFIASTELFFLNKTGIFSNYNDKMEDLENFGKKYPIEFCQEGNVLVFKAKIT